ncbi:hypothetical protein PC114_g15429 [Phytophthora cactorum]|uniref:Uncharacterized protein n=1 Tax=Phytophthora cactorum TaxID=29920 RepID=A0A8T1CJ23_9STRA|nr:hypothetical protein PC114_g15429 [Phytophthora cactorum]KAG2922943.1 hypothetical protein PC117_g15849 [Phytophthora cactorum]
MLYHLSRHYVQARVCGASLASFAKMPARRKSVELSLKRQAIDWIATEGGGVPSRAEAPFRQRGWRVKAACFRRCVVKKSIGKYGFHDDPDDWFITRHDVYDAQFRQAWSAASLDDQAADSSGANEDEVDELLDAFDEVWIED